MKKKYLGFTIGEWVIHSFLGVLTFVALGVAFIHLNDKWFHIDERNITLLDFASAYMLLKFFLPSPTCKCKCGKK